jgi:hypothetical protein
MHGRGVVDDAMAQQRPILHQAEHGFLRVASFAGGGEGRKDYSVVEKRNPANCRVSRLAQRSNDAIIIKMGLSSFDACPVSETGHPLTTAVLTAEAKTASVRRRTPVGQSETSCMR